jgi:hypothetical protein
MDMSASSSTIRPAEVIATPSAREVHAGDAPCPRRSRAKRLTFVNRSTRLGKRIDELTALCTSAFSADELTPLRREKIASAAQLQGLAEEERGRWMRGEARCNLDELISAERRAASAVKALALPEAKQKPQSGPLAAHFSRGGEA